MIMTADLFELAENADVVRRLADGLAVAPPDGLLSAVLGRLPDAPPSGLRFHTADPGAFQPTARAGVSIRLLHTDRAAGRFSAYLRLDPGASLHAHVHDGAEECVVLAGSITTAGRTLTAGDYQRADPGSPHGEQVSADGCLLFLTGPLSLLAE